MRINFERLSKLHSKLTEYNFEKLEKEYGARMLLFSGDELLSNKQLLISLGMEKAAAEDYLQKNLFEFVNKFGSYGYDMKTGSNMYGVAFILPNLSKSAVKNEVYSSGDRFHNLVSGLKELERFKNQGLV